MPIFEYKCALCGAISEFLEKPSSRTKHRCPKCDSNKMEKMLSSFSPIVRQRGTGGKCDTCTDTNAHTHKPRYQYQKQRFGPLKRIKKAGLK